ERQRRPGLFFLRRVQPTLDACSLLRGRPGVADDGQDRADHVLRRATLEGFFAGVESLGDPAMASEESDHGELGARILGAFDVASPQALRLGQLAELLEPMRGELWPAVGLLRVFLY